MAFSPDGRRLVSAGLDQTVKLWDAATGREVLTLRGHLDNVFSVAFSPDGHQLASASLDNTVRIWDATPMDEEPDVRSTSPYRGHAGAVTDVAFHPNDGAASFPPARTERSGCGTSEAARSCRIVHESPSGSQAARGLQPRRTTPGHGEYSRDSTACDVCGRSPTAKEICRFSGSYATRSSVWLSALTDGTLPRRTCDSMIRVWDATTPRKSKPSRSHKWPIHGVAFSPDGRHLASASADSTVRVWDWTTGQEPRVLSTRHTGRVNGVAFSRDGKLLASGSWDRTIKVWDTATWKLQHDLPDPTGGSPVRGIRQ